MERLSTEPLWNQSPSRESLSSERGQVIVEQAIILPVMVFLILGIVQLAMIQHARICTEYAAFNAARAGIVYNGDPDMMERAAFLSLMPTYGRS
ncbi:MAG: pilus assembly protein, partial [Deltaproteobacteria bacterium]